MRRYTSERLSVSNKPRFPGKGINIQALQPRLVQSIFLSSSQFCVLGPLGSKCLDLAGEGGGLEWVWST